MSRVIAGAVVRAIGWTDQQRDLRGSARFRSDSCPSGVRP